MSSGQEFNVFSCLLAIDIFVVHMIPYDLVQIERNQPHTLFAN